MSARVQMQTVLAVFIFLMAVMSGFGAEPARKTLSDRIVSVVSRLTPIGRVAATNELSLAIGLPLRNEAGLDDLIRQLYDPASTNYHKYLTPPEFTARFGPTESDYAAVKEFARTNGLAITGTPDSRLLLDVSGPAAAVEKAFHVMLRTYRHPSEARDFYAPDIEPTVAADLPVVDISGLTDYYRMHSKNHRIHLAARSGVVAKNGSAPDGSGTYFGDDFRTAYVPGTTLTGAGQMVGLLQFDGFYSNDIAAYATAAGGGRTNIVIQTVLLDGFNGVPTTGANSGNDEVSLDIEMVMAMAPGLSKIVVFEAPNNTAYFNDVLNAMASTNTYPLLNNLSCSWGGGGPKSSSETIFKKMAAQGQSFFNASGDSDAFTGAVPFPSESTNITQVGGTTLTTSSSAAYISETVWNWGVDYGSIEDGVGSSGGISTTYGIPSWQQGISMTANHGSSSMRNIPDVALTANKIYIIYGGSGAGANNHGGTSFAAPLWAGFMALVNQQAAATGQSPAGFINPAIYAIGKSSVYNSCFNDITNSNNFWSSSPTNFPAVAGLDLCTGWGTPNGTNLINALLAPPPMFFAQPAAKNVTNGATVSFTGTATSALPFSYYWLLNGTNLPAGGNVSGVSTNTLTLTAVTTNNSGLYQLVASNATGYAVSTGAVLNVGFAPTASVSPASLTVFAGSNAVYTATIGGSSPFSYQWKRGGTNFAGANITGTNAAMLTISSAVTNYSGNYTIVVTNLFGSVTSSVAALTVVLPAAIASSSLTNRTVECGKNTNTFVLTATGTAPLSYQWSTNGVAVTGATGTSFGLTNLHLATITNVAVIVTNLYGSATSNAVITVTDLLAPVITLTGASRMTNELGSAFTDPGATANDTCAGSLTVAVSGTVITNAVGTNTLTYTASDGNGNTATTNRTVVVRDTTPPVISSSFTNLIVAANSNCVALMTNVTGTNFIIATDSSGSVTVTQSPTNNATLQFGTNTVVLTVADPSGNKSYSTNRIVVSDQTPPVFVSQPQSRTNFAGTTANFSVAATGCTTLSYQWFFNSAPLTARTNVSLSLSNLTTALAGNYFAVATAAGGSSTSAVATLTVNLNPASVALASSANPDGFKDSLNFTAAVTPTNATGTIQFLTNGTAFDLEPLAAGAANSTNLSTLPRGTNFITAIYSGDAGDLPATNTLAQIVTNHPPQVAPAFYTLVAGLDLTIAVADLATNWSDADGDLLAIAFINASTNGVTVTNALPDLFYTNPNYISDQFVCAVSDGFGGTNFQTVNITVVPQTNSTPAISSVAVQPASGVTLKLNGGDGSTYVLESTGDLLAGNWEPVATNTLGITGTWQFTDFSATNNPARFYRLKLVQ
jgi:hypothetical protein